MAEMKSALELAMEKIGKLQGEESSGSLSDAQRRDIGDLRSQYDAKIAEKEIMLQAEIRQLLQRHAPQEAALAARRLQEQFQDTKKALLQELEEKITAIRTTT